MVSSGKSRSFKLITMYAFSGLTFTSKLSRCRSRSLSLVIFLVLVPTLVHFAGWRWQVLVLLVEFILVFWVVQVQLSLVLCFVLVHLSLVPVSF